MRDGEREIEREKVSVETEIGKAIVSNTTVSIGSHTVRLSLSLPPSLFLSLSLSHPVIVQRRGVVFMNWRSIQWTRRRHR